MNLHRQIMETTAGLRAGIVPFLADGRCLFFVSSDPKYGGSDPAIAKGRVDSGEDAKAAAVREGREELGLRRDNMATQPWLGWSGEISGQEESYKFEVYAVLMKDEDAFDTPGKETAHTVWLTRSEFTTKGRKSHGQIMDRILDKIEAYLKK